MNILTDGLIDADPLVLGLALLLLLVCAAIYFIRRKTR